MKREIKFRAWDETEQKIRSVIKINFHDGDYDVMLLTPTDSAPNHWRLRKFNQIKLMQYTGLKDKNGVEIYEGDLLKGETETFEVYYDTQNSSFRIVTRVLNKEHKFDTVRYSFPDNLGNGYLKRRDLEVIGNIHQNHELL